MTLITVDLRSEAIAEAERLERARALLLGTESLHLEQLEVMGTWIAKSRKHGLRRRLAGRVCLVWRVVFEEPSGRFVESILVPMLIDPKGAANPSSRRWVESWIRQGDSAMRARVAVECAAWRIRVVELVSTCTSLRANRQRAIAGQADRCRRDAQPGLFDRRAERERQAYASAAADAEREAASRLQAIVESATIALRPAQLLLVLLP